MPDDFSKWLLLYSDPQNFSCEIVWVAIILENLSTKSVTLHFMKIPPPEINPLHSSKCTCPIAQVCYPYLDFYVSIVF